MKDIKVISVDDLHNTITSFISNGKHIIGEYEDMKEMANKKTVEELLAK